jgi:hypothetical protein
MPKSISFTVPSRVIMMLLGLMSRWTMAERSNTYCRARQTRLAMKMERSTSGRRRTSRCRSRYSIRLQPSMYSRMMQSLPSTFSKSKMRPMFSWSRTAYRRASSTNMRRWPTSSVWRSCFITIGRWKPDCPMSRPL